MTLDQMTARKNRQTTKLRGYEAAHCQKRHCTIWKFFETMKKVVADEMDT